MTHIDGVKSSLLHDDDDADLIKDTDNTGSDNLN